MKRLTVLCGLALAGCSGSITEQALSAPTQLTVSQMGFGLHLTWKDNASNEDEFQIERKSGGAGFAMIGSVVFDTVQFHDEPVVAGTAYSYRVRAIKGPTPSAYSNQATATAPGGSGGGAGGGSGADAGNGAPSCAITAPDGGLVVPYDLVVTFTASASDPEDGPLSGASIVWTSNLVTPPLGSGLTLSRSLPTPGVHTVSCRVTDSSGLTGSSSVLVTAVSPVAVINHPGNGETRPASMPIPFIGDGRDFEDGPLPDAGLVWTSSLDGVIGTGRTFNRVLSAGTNVITLKVTDSDGGTGSRSVSLTITP